MPVVPTRVPSPVSGSTWTSKPPKQLTNSSPASNRATFPILPPTLLAGTSILCPKEDRSVSASIFAEMTLGTFLPLAFAFIALVEIPLFLKWRERGMIGSTAAIWMIAFSFSLPIALYLLFALFIPDIGNARLF